MEKLQLDEYPITFKNFRGEKGQYNAEGERSFSILIEDPEEAIRLIDLGWALRPLKVREEGDPVVHHLPVKVGFGGYSPPRIYKVSMSSNSYVQLDSNTVAMLDWLSIAHVDVILNPYEWSVLGETGVKAYLNTMFVVLDENALDLKYAGFVESGVGYEE